MISIARNRVLGLGRGGCGRCREVSVLLFLFAFLPQFNPWEPVYFLVGRKLKNGKLGTGRFMLIFGCFHH